MKTLQELIAEREELIKFSTELPWHIGHIKDEDGALVLMDVEEADGCIVADSVMEHHAKLLCFLANHDTQIIDGLLEIINECLDEQEFNIRQANQNGFIIKIGSHEGAKQALQINLDSEVKDE